MAELAANDFTEHIPSLALDHLRLLDRREVNG
jgi:hypothetical protein